jgi:acetate kinase
MGMTPLEGIVMGTRAGSVDPGMILAAQRDHGIDQAALLEILEHRSGLLGVSGRSADMRELLAAEPTNERAALAVKIFVRSVAAGVAAAATALPRVDAIVFTGGIGENAAEIRARIVGALVSLGVPAITSPSTNEDAVLARGPISVLRIAAREDVIVAREVRRLVDRRRV